MEQKFHNVQGVVRYAYNEPEAVRLRAQGFRELEDKPEKAKPEAKPERKEDS